MSSSRRNLSDARTIHHAKPALVHILAKEMQKVKDMKKMTIEIICNTKGVLNTNQKRIKPGRRLINKCHNVITKTLFYPRSAAYAAHPKRRYQTLRKMLLWLREVIQKCHAHQLLLAKNAKNLCFKSILLLEFYRYDDSGDSSDDFFQRQRCR